MRRGIARELLRASARWLVALWCLREQKAGVGIPGADPTACSQVGDGRGRLVHRQLEPAPVDQGVPVVRMIAQARVERPLLDCAGGP